MTMVSRSIILLAVCALAGCAGTVYRQNAAQFEATQPESAWGRKPPDGHQAVEMAMIKARLFDPYSADIRPGAVQRYVIPETFTSTVPVPVWGSQIFVNAKNRLGGYTGMKDWIFMYRDGKLFAVQDDQGVKVWVGQEGASGEGLQRAANDLRRQLGQ